MNTDAIVASDYVEGIDAASKEEAEDAEAPTTITISITKTRYTTVSASDPASHPASATEPAWGTIWVATTMPTLTSAPSIGRPRNTFISTPQPKTASRMAVIFPSPMQSLVFKVGALRARRAAAGFETRAVSDKGKPASHSHSPSPTHPAAQPRVKRNRFRYHSQQNLEPYAVGYINYIDVSGESHPDDVALRIPAGTIDSPLLQHKGTASTLPAPSTLQTRFATATTGTAIVPSHSHAPSRNNAQLRYKNPPSLPFQVGSVAGMPGSGGGGGPEFDLPEVPGSVLLAVGVGLAVGVVCVVLVALVNLVPRSLPPSRCNSANHRTQNANTHTENKAGDGEDGENETKAQQPWYRRIFAPRGNGESRKPVDKSSKYTVVPTHTPTDMGPSTDSTMRTTSATPPLRCCASVSRLRANDIKTAPPRNLRAYRPGSAVSRIYAGSRHRSSEKMV
jgi:hypothetical protein